MSDVAWEVGSPTHFGEFTPPRADSETLSNKWRIRHNETNRDRAIFALT
jgi:hypothetical protein